MASVATPLPPTGGPGGVNLDSPPPQPPQSSRRSLMDLKSPEQPTGGLGPDASNPAIMALQGLKLMEAGSQLLGSALPALAQPLTAIIGQLRQTVPQAMAESMGPPGPTSPPPAGPAAPPPTGGVTAPMAPPPTGMLPPQ